MFRQHPKQHPATTSCNHKLALSLSPVPEWSRHDGNRTPDTITQIQYVPNVRIWQFFKSTKKKKNIRGLEKTFDLHLKSDFRSFPTACLYSIHKRSIKKLDLAGSKNPISILHTSSSSINLKLTPPALRLCFLCNISTDKATVSNSHGTKSNFFWTMRSQRW